MDLSRLSTIKPSQIFPRTLNAENSRKAMKCAAFKRPLTRKPGLRELPIVSMTTLEPPVAAPPRRPHRRQVANASMQPRNLQDALMTPGASVAAKLTVKDVECQEFYREHMQAGKHLGSYGLYDRRPKAKIVICINWFEAMVTSDERNTLLSRQSAQSAQPTDLPDLAAQQRRIVLKLNNLIVKKLISSFESWSIKTPTDLLNLETQGPQKGKPKPRDYILKINSLERRSYQLRKANDINGTSCQVEVSHSAFQIWRLAYEAHTECSIEPNLSQANKRQRR
jgi:hypothetical protein